MKKIFTLVAALLTTAAINAQDVQVGMTDKGNVDVFTENMVMGMGVSADGKYVIGATLYEGGAAYYDIETGQYVAFDPDPELEDYSTGVLIPGISYDGIAFVCENDRVYTYNIKDGTRTDFVSPDPVLGFDVWDVTSDGSVLAGNFTDVDAVACEPMVGIRQSDGTYEFTRLEYEKNDIFGTPAQFTQVRHVTEDGNNIIGAQIDARGKAPRLVVWTKQEDGTYKYSTPIDEYIYDLTAEKPCKKPIFEEYVTADKKTDPELYEQQRKEFQEAFAAYQEMFGAFTRDNSMLDVMQMHRGRRSNIIYAGYKTNNGVCPIYYNCDTKETTTNAEPIGYAYDDLPGGGAIGYDEGTTAYAIDENGVERLFTDWLGEVTGTEIDPMLSNGYANFSHNGKTLAISGFGATSVYTFDIDIFAALTTGVGKVNITNNVSFKGNELNIGGNKHGIADVYMMNGTKCGSYNVNGSIDFNGILPAGTYIVKTNIEGAEPISMKVVVR